MVDQSLAPEGEKGKGLRVVEIYQGPEETEHKKI